MAISAALWYCCQCNNGPMSIPINPACHTCNHRHGGCRYCMYAPSRPGGSGSYDSRGAGSSTGSRPKRLHVSDAIKAEGPIDDDKDDDDGHRSSASSRSSRSVYSAFHTPSATQHSKYSPSEVVSARLELVQLLSNDEFLEPLYQEAIKSKSISAKRFTHKFYRLLKTYSEDLKKEASESREFAAAKLVRISAIQVVESIKQRYSWEAETRELDEAVEDSSDEEPTADLFDEFEEQTLPTLAPAKNFLTKTLPYGKLKRNFESFVRRSVDSLVETEMEVEMREVQDASCISGDSSRKTEQTWGLVVRQWLAHVGIIEKPLKSGKHRLRWRCCCGIELFDDYINSEITDFEELQRLLDHSSDIQEASAHSEQQHNSSSTGTSTFSRFTTSITGFFSHQYGKLFSSPSLPTHNSSDLENSVRADENVAEGTPMHLLLCISTGSLGAMLDQKLINFLNNDRELFALLQEVYFHQRGKLRSWFSLRAPVGVNFVEFSLLASHHVDIHQHQTVCKGHCVCLPPKRLVDNLEYTYKPVPPKRSPPIGPKAMAHYLMHPSHVKEGSVWMLNQIPKKLKGKLEEKLDDDVNGWGIQFEEGPDWSKIWTAMTVVFVLGSVLFGILWSVFEQDVQASFGVSNWWISLCTVFLGYWTTRKG